MKFRFRFALAIFALSPCSIGFSQTTAAGNSDLRPVARQYGGWSSSPAQAASGEPRTKAEGRQVQQAFYQTQGSLSDSLPVLPAANFPAANGLNAASAGNTALPQLPNFPPAGAPAPNAATANSSLPEARSRDVLPPNPSASPSPLGGVDTNPLPRERGIPAQPAGYTQQGADLRTIREPTQQSSTGGATSGLRNPQEFATGLPYVTPAPRTGRYPTSPYMGPRYQVTAFQQQSTIPARTVAAQSGGLSAPAATDAADQRPVLPQNQPVTGVYPTAFQPAAYQQCAPQDFPATGAVPGAYVPPTYTPNLTPGLYSSNNSGYSPIFSLGQENYNVLLGRGIIGQPTVYVPGQPFRNFFRYISP